MNEPLNLRTAVPADAEEVLSLYTSLVGQPGCTWDEDYPGMSEIEEDIALGNLFVASDERGIFAAISVTNDPELDEMDCWSEDCLPAQSFMRVAVRRDCQRHGIARRLVIFALKKIKDRGCRGVHILVGQHNEPALRCYAPFGFKNVCERNTFGVDWFCYEGNLDEILSNQE